MNSNKRPTFIHTRLPIHINQCNIFKCRVNAGYVFLHSTLNRKKTQTRTEHFQAVIRAKHDVSHVHVWLKADKSKKS